MATAVNTSTQQYFGFDPRTIPGCVLWHDAVDSGTFTFSSGSVTAWRNKASTTSAVATANTSITLNANGLGTGYPALTFTNTQWLSGAVSITGTPSLSVFSVFSMSASSRVAARTLSLAATEANDFDNIGFVGILRQTVANMGPYRNFPYAGAALSYDTRLIHTSVIENSVMFSRVNGGGRVQIATTNTNFNISAYRIANSTATADVNSPFFGFIGEVITYNTALTEYERQQVEGYLAWKWGLQANLPVGHAFKYNPTTMRVFRPIDIDTCALWLDAADSSTMLPANITSGTAITRWTDKSSNATFAIPERGPSGIAPVFSNVGGVQSIFINNNNSPNYNASTFAQLTLQTNIQTTQDYTVFAVINFNTFANAPSLQTIYSNRRSGVHRAPQMGVGSTFETNSSTFRFIDIAFIGTGILQTCLISSVGSFSQNRNGSFYGNVAGGLATRFSVDTDPLPTIGGTFSSVGQDNRFTTGHFHELILYNKALTSSERERVEGYLAEKWRTPALPSSAPYFSQRALPSTPVFVPSSLSVTSSQTPNLLCRFFNLTTTPPSTTLGGSGWGNEIGISGQYNPINFQDGDGRIGQSDNVGIACTGFVFSGSSGTIRFRVVTDDGSIVRFNGVDVISSWTFQGDTTYTSASLTLNPGYTPIEYLFFEAGGGMTCELYYELNNSGTFLSDGTGVFFGSSDTPLALWLDSADPSTFTLSGSNVTQWRDKSGNNRHGTPPAVNNQPTYNGDGLLFSAGGVQYLPLSNVSGMLTNVAFNIFVVERNQGAYTAGVTEGFFLGAETIVEGGALHIGYRETATLRFATFGAGTDLDATGLPTGTTTRMWSFNMPQTSNRNINLNGTLVATHGNTTKLNAMVNLSIGRAFGGNYYRGRIYEILIYRGGMTPAQIQQVEGYLAWKWGLQTLLPTAPTFTPASVSPAIWLDAADSSTFTLSGSNVAEWRDKSGNARHYTQADASLRPTFQQNGVNTVGNQFLANGADIRMAGRDIFVVGTPLTFANRGSSGWRTLLRGSATEHPIIIAENGTALGCYLEAGLFNQYGSLVLTGENRALIYVNTAPATLRGPPGIPNAALNGTIRTSAAVNHVAATTNFFALGNFQGGGQPWGEINELIITSNTTSDQRRQIQEYLAAKWGVPLPSPVVHPYYKFRP